jgi:aminoglycoside phosphotransferase family enzyme
MTRPEPAAIVETHSAVVVFIGDRAYKVKKPVDLGFLDFRSRTAREAVCHREVELNRRLAPDVYLGVSDVLDPAGNVCEHLVLMRRMPDDRRLSRLAREGLDLHASMRQIAHQVAALHGRAERTDAADAAAGAQATRARW